jgi:L-alanine-DL-glutamate epimerase-like enolase superfamily enzyme
MTSALSKMQTAVKIDQVTVHRRPQASDLIEVRTAEGIIGHGEGAWGEPALRGDSKLVIGRSAFEVEAIFEDLAASGEVPGGLDIALWDLVGQALAMPVSQVLGKTHRDKVLVSTSFEETPVPDGGLAGYRRLRESSTEPIAGGLSLAPETLLRDLVQTELVDIAVQDVGRCGLTGLRRLAYFCWLFRVRLVPCCSGGPIGMAAALHAAACIPPVTNAIAAPPVFLVAPGAVAGEMEVPRSPGLGIALAPIAGTPYFEIGGERC